MPILSFLSPPAAYAAELRMDSDPSGATVLLNGHLAGATPLVVDGLSDGVYALRLEKNGCQSVSRQVILDAQHAAVKETLAVLPTTLLRVEIQPEGAEVLIDGELIGNTPLRYDQLTGGPHELVIRKTNYDTYSRLLDVVPGQPQVFSGFALRDKIESMLNDLIHAEPQRVTHYIDLAHYYFVNGRMEQAAQAFAKGFETVYTPLDFSGPGYAGAPPLSEEEKALERTLRSEDTGRFWGEMQKHRGWERKDSNVFRSKLDEMLEKVAAQYAASWEWTEHTAKMLLREDPERAAKTYQRHIAAAPDSPHLASAYLGLAEIYLAAKKEQPLNDAFGKFFEAARSNGPMLMACEEKFAPLNKEPKAPLYATVLAMREKVLRRAQEITEKDTKAECMFNLGLVLDAQKRWSEAVPFLEHSIATTKDIRTKEDRQFQLGGVLVRAGRTEEARGIYTKLQNSRDGRIKQKARSELLKLASVEAKK